MANDSGKSSPAAADSAFASGSSTASDSTNQSVEEYFRSGWSHYSKKEYYRAEADFQKALAAAPGNVDVLYGLGMALQASGRQPEAISTFESVIQLLSMPAPEDKVRAFMLARLARGHVNRIKTGDWKLQE
jgi:tetratricopeptide (TPR) repeat protein